MSLIEDYEVRAAHRFSLRFPWRDKTAGASGCEEIKIFSRHPREWYGRFRLENRAFATSLADAKSACFSALSRVIFMDVTNFKHSKSTNAVAVLSGRSVWPAGFEFVRLWLCPTNKRLLLTVEPPGKWLHFVEEECKARAWPFHVFPPGVGMRNPAAGTRLVIASPQGVDIGPVVTELERALPRCEMELA
jgi:hypothetical protein